MCQPLVLDHALQTVSRLAEEWPDNIVLTADLYFMPCASWLGRTVQKLSCGCYEADAHIEQYKKINDSQKALTEVVINVLRYRMDSQPHRALCHEAINRYNRYIDTWGIGPHHKINFSELLLTCSSSDSSNKTALVEKARQLDSIEKLREPTKKIVEAYGLNPNVFNQKALIAQEEGVAPTPQAAEAATAIVQKEQKTEEQEKKEQEKVEQPIEKIEKQLDVDSGLPHETCSTQVEEVKPQTRLRTGTINKIDYNLLHKIGARA